MKTIKSITIFITLIAHSIVFSQVLPFNFSDPIHLMTGQEGTTTSIITDGGNSVLQIVGGTTHFDRADVVLAQNVNLSNDANNTITFRIKSNVADQRTHLLKFEQGVGGPATTELAFTTTGTAWQNISLNFPAGLVNYAKIIIFTDFNNTLTGSYLIDDFAGGTNVSIPIVVAPTVAAPTPPVRNATDVINLYSNAYTEVAGTNWNPNWGQSTVASEVQIAGNATRKMAILNYQGAVIAAAQNVSTMTNLHLDVWTPDCNSFSVFLISPPQESPVILTPTFSGWNSFDIPLSSYNVPNLNLIKELKFVSGTAGTTVFMDNIYFWKPAILPGTPVITGFSISDKILGNSAFTINAPTSDSPGAFSYTSSNISVATVSGDTITIVGIGRTTITASQDASGSFLAASVTTILTVSAPPSPVPTLLASEVVSMYGESYPNTYQYSFGSLEGEIDLDPSSGVNLALKYNFEIAGYGAGYTSTDVSDMQYVHFDYFTTNSSNFKFVLISNTGEKDYVLPDSQSIVLNTWKSVTIPMSYFTGLGFNPATWFQFKFDANRNTPNVSNVVYIDNVYFSKQAVIIPSNTVQNLCAKTIQPYNVNDGDATHIGSTYAWNISPAAPNAIITGNGSNSITIDWTNVSDGSYTLQATETSASGCVSTAVSATINISATPAPTSLEQTYCASATMANLTATGTNIKWYAAANGGTSLATSTVLETGTYYASQTIYGCESTRTAVVVIINPQIIPLFTQIASTCSGSNLNALPITSINGISGTWSPALNNTVTTTYIFTPNIGQCANSFSQTINITTPKVTSAISFVAPQVTVATLPNVTIGTQIWTNKNLDVTTYSDGTPIPEVTDPAAWAALTTGAWCYYNNDPANGAIYGKLYNWYAVSGIYDNDPNTPNKTLAPIGWQVPSDAEWNTLSNFLGGESVSAGKMKAIGTALWASPNADATNSSGFTGLPGGYRFNGGPFNFISEFGIWWSSSETSATEAWGRSLNYGNGNENANSGSANKAFGGSVRVIKN